MKKLCLLLCISVIFQARLLSARKEDPFKPNGKAEVDIFTNFSSSFSDGDNHNKFDIGRAYLGYIYNFSEKLTGRVTYDAGYLSLGKSHYTGFLKFAYLEFHTAKWKINGGMIMPKQFDYTNTRWGYRYVYKPMHDEYGFGYSSDMGFSVEHIFCTWLSADGIISNGESFKLMESDSTLRVGLALTIKPLKNASLRCYYDRMKKGTVNQQTHEIVAFYESADLRFGISYSHQKDHALIAGHDYSGISFNGSVTLPKNMKLWARFDHVTSDKVKNAAIPWNLSKDGDLYMAGIEFLLTRGVTLSPNLQGWQPADDNKPFVSRFCISLDIKI